ncbi:GIY-YIG nuclease family protein [Caulobacter sp. KR2-114]|uniref:GIY-YIG nuclease family protein n=1 Tax=Caulobacter sp. KR2-114 TaxID=3400912 RepID=UPI003C0C2229
MSQRFPYPAVYMLASRPFGVLYVGVTNDLPRRVFEHQQGVLAGFSREHGCGLLVWYEPHAMMIEAILREKRIKRWRRAWKFQLVEQMNPDWTNLALTLNQ